MIPIHWRNPVRVWWVGTALSLAYYGFRVSAPVLRTEVGRETRVFGLGGLDFKMDQKPGTRAGWNDWVIAGADDPTAGVGPAWVNWCLRHRWAGWSPRALSAFPDGTWRWDGTRLTRVWRFRDGSWLDTRHLTAPAEFANSDHVLDLETGRTFSGERSQDLFGNAADDSGDAGGDTDNDADAALQSFNDDWGGEGPVPPSADLAIVAPALEGTSQYSGESQVSITASRIVFLIHNKEPGADLLIASNDLAPRIRLLAQRADPLEVSHDGRVLFFQRDGQLWRLDLRKTMPELLDEVAIPELPPVPGVDPALPKTGSRQEGVSADLLKGSELPLELSPL